MCSFIFTLHALILLHHIHCRWQPKPSRRDHVLPGPRDAACVSALLVCGGHVGRWVHFWQHAPEPARAVSGPDDCRTVNCYREGTWVHELVISVPDLFEQLNTNRRRWARRDSCRWRESTSWTSTSARFPQTCRPPQRRGTSWYRLAGSTSQLRTRSTS